MIRLSIDGSENNQEVRKWLDALSEKINLENPDLESILMHLRDDMLIRSTCSATVLNGKLIRNTLTDLDQNDFERTCKDICEEERHTA